MRLCVWWEHTEYGLLWLFGSFSRQQSVWHNLKTKAMMKALTTLHFNRFSSNLSYISCNRFSSKKNPCECFLWNLTILNCFVDPIGWSCLRRRRNLPRGFILVNKSENAKVSIMKIVTPFCHCYPPFCHITVFSPPCIGTPKRFLVSHLELELVAVLTELLWLWSAASW